MAAFVEWCDICNGELSNPVIIEGWKVCDLCSNLLIFVFGSNLEGKHGSGAAKYARKYHGAKYGQGEGLQGNSYGLPTKETPYKSLSLKEIELHVRDFIFFAKSHPGLYFRLTRVGCGRAGYTSSQIAPMFHGISSNVIIPLEWLSFIQR